MRTLKRCLKYDSTRNFYHQIDNIIMPDRNLYINYMKYIKIMRQGDHYSLTNYSGSLVKKKNIRMTKATNI